MSLVTVVAIAGASQGLTMPLLSIMLEQKGLSAFANGFNAASMYIGILLISPWVEILLRRYGYRTIIVSGLILVTTSTILLPMTSGFAIWFILRLLMGVGDSALHFASQIWVTAITPAATRGRSLSIYGLAYEIGFGIGPLGILLLPYGEWAPLAAVSVLYTGAFFMLSTLQNECPEPAPTKGTKSRYLSVFRIGWLALIPSFLYGYLEASLNGSFPVYALRVGLAEDWIPIILPSFVIGSLVLQLPLGTLSDRIGRKKVMLICAITGGAAFILFPSVSGQPIGMMILLAVAGAVDGSFYSLGLAFAADILPAGMVPTAGIIAGMNFSIVSILAPNVNGFLIDHANPDAMFVVIGGMLSLFAGASFFFRHSLESLKFKKGFR